MYFGAKSANQSLNNSKGLLQLQAGLLQLQAGLLQLQAGLLHPDASEILGSLYYHN
jgi:uncharacterized phage infection (PIP) family protein YhgE